MDYRETVRIPEDYFREMSRKDYSNMERALVREFFQNSVDAGARTFIVLADEKAREFMFIDDGCGMDEETIRNRLLVMGGTTKNPDGGDVGAFGHAKILIYFSWDEYEIRTRDLIVRGKANLYTVEKSPWEYVKGTVSTIRVDSKERFDNIYYEISPYFRSCETSCRVFLIRLDDEGRVYVHLLSQELTRKRAPVMVMDYFDLYEVDGDTPETRGNTIYVRTNGVTMFSIYNWNLSKPLILESKKHPYKVFNQNRDSLKELPQAEVSTLQSMLASDDVSTLRRFQTQREAAVTDKEANDYAGKYVKYGDIWCFGVPPAHGEVIAKDRLVKVIQKFSERVLENLGFRAGEVKIAYFISNEGVLGWANNHPSLGPLIALSLPNLYQYRKDTRRMVFEILEILCHEAAHLLTMETSGYGAHNESFVCKMTELRRKVWDLKVWHKAYRDLWYKGE